MAKRFTDSAIYNKAWFMDLSIQHKAFWDYLCRTCDNAGIWEKNFKLASLLLGHEFEEKDLAYFGDKLTPLEDSKVFIPGFIKFQYGELSESVKPHLGAIKRLKEVGIDPKTLLLKGLPNPLVKSQTVQQTVQEKEKEQDKDKEKEKEGGAGGDFSPNMDEVRAAIAAYQETLAHFKIVRPIWPHEEKAIYDLAKSKKNAKRVHYAVVGMRFEKATDSFKPADYVTLERLWKHFDRFENLAIQAKNKQGGAT